MLAAIFLGQSVTSPPAEWKLDPFYKKCVMLDGLPIVSSDKVPDEALFEAHRLAKIMLERIPQARKKMIQNRVRIAIMAKTEVTLDIPEHSDLQRAFPETNWNTRARGLGATKARPAISGAEENLLQLPGDRYKGESIFMHEFAHAIMDMGLMESDPWFEPALRSAFANAMMKKRWHNTYAATNVHEYWAEGVQSWLRCNRSASPSNGIHNDIDTPEELRGYDPEFAAILARIFGSQPYRWDRDPLRPKREA